MKTHFNKAKYYDEGRPEYPKEFFDFLYDELAIKTTDTIADIGCGTGKIAVHFLERGNKVFSVEYDENMLEIANDKLREHPNFVPLHASAENTTIESGVVNYIICGNSYAWFDHSRAVPEFKRISRADGYTIVVYPNGKGNEENGFMNDLSVVYEKYEATTAAVPGSSYPMFKDDQFIEKFIDHTDIIDRSKNLYHALSMSFAPSEEQDSFHTFCEEINHVFDKHAIDGIVEIPLKLKCVIGKTESLCF